MAVPRAKYRATPAASTSALKDQCAPRPSPLPDGWDGRDGLKDKAGPGWEAPSGSVHPAFLVSTCCGMRAQDFGLAERGLLTLRPAQQGLTDERAAGPLPDCPEYAHDSYPF